MKSKTPVIITIIVVIVALAVVMIFTNVFGFMNKTENIEQDDVIEDEITYEEIHKRIGNRLDTEMVNTLKVGDICYFIDEEVASIPYRWFYDISNERVMGLYSDESWSDSDSNAAPGGLKGWRLIHFEALAPGGCTIMIESKYMFDDEEPFSEEYANIYKIIVKD